jgi:predicted ATPase/DNA-binding SARP family transcriptional activator
MEIRLCGGLAVEYGGEPLEEKLPGRQGRLLLAYLALNGGRGASRGELIDAVWYEHRPARPEAALSTVLSRLRGVLPEGLIEGRRELSLRVGRGDQLDVPEAEAALQRARAAAARRDWEAAEDGARTALGIASAPLLPGHEAPWLDEWRRWLDGLAVEALELCAAAGVRREDADLAAAEAAARALVEREPYRESGYLCLMEVQAARGNAAEALRVYEQLRALLSDELGAAPGPGVKDLHERLLRGEAVVFGERSAAGGVAPPTAPQPSTIPARVGMVAPRPGLLPALPAPLVGRERDARAVIHLLRQPDVRLVTLTGVGGVGKTSLAIEVGYRSAGELADGVAFVDLAPLSDPRDIADTMLHALGCKPEPGATATETLCRVAAGRELLLVLDNSEHLLAGAPLLVDLLQAAPRLKLMVTSRTALELRAEHRYRLDPLALPDTHEPAAVAAAPATALFIARATAHDPSFRLTTGNAEAIATVCARMDGLPLAIELAATRCGVLSAQEIARRLGRGLPALRFRARDAPERHRTLRATLDWSYNLLPRDEQLAFGRVSVFAGGFALEAVAAVCFDGDPDSALETIARLVEASLVLAEEREGRTRYRLLETMRQYAAQQLAASDHEAATRRHARYYLRLAEQAEPHLMGAEQAAWLERLEREHDNLRVALQSSVAGTEAEMSLRLAGALFWFWYLHGHYREGRQWLSRALAAETGASTSARAKALKGSGILALLQCEYGQATELLAEGLALYRELEDKRGVASSLQVLGSVARERADYDGAVAFYEESLVLWRDLEDRQGIARSLNYLGFVAWLAGEHGKAKTLSLETLGRFRELGDREGIAWSLLNLGATALHRGDHACATALCKDALKRSREIGYKEGVAWSLNLLGVVAQREGDEARASAYLIESLAGHAELGDRWRAASVLDALAAFAREQDEPRRSARLFGAAEALRETIGAPVPACERAARDWNVAAARAGSEAEAFAQAWSEGRAMTLNQAAAEASKTPGRSEKKARPTLVSPRGLDLERVGVNLSVPSDTRVAHARSAIASRAGRARL